MFHSIIIPFCDRKVQTLRASGKEFFQHDYLVWTLWSIARSAVHMKVDAYEVLVVDATPPEAQRRGLGVLDSPTGRVRWIDMEPSGPYFNKPAAINRGIDEAGGTVLSFLDADMLVGRRWMGVAGSISYPRPTRICYRVRQLPKTAIESLCESSAYSTAEPLVTGWFLKYPSFTRAAECYGEPDRSPVEDEEPCPFGPHVFGNSQFSMASRWTRDVRCDESYAGRGYEDIAFVQDIRELANQEEDGYSGLILTEPDFALLHMRHDSHLTKDGYWNNVVANKLNHKRFVRRMGGGLKG